MRLTDEEGLKVLKLPELECTMKLNGFVLIRKILNGKIDLK